MSEVYIPATIEETCQLLTVSGRSLVAGATNLYVDRFEGRELDKDIISLHRLAELKNISFKEDGCHIGSLVTFDKLEQTFLHDAATASSTSAALTALGKAASLVGGPQVRNRGTIGGNIVSASPSADTVPVLEALDASVILTSVDGTRQIPVRDFMTGVKRTAIRENELLTEIIIPEAKGKALFEKVGTRNALAIAVCNLCVAMDVSDQKVSHIAIAIGSCAPTCVRAAATEKALLGLEKPVTEEDWQKLKATIADTLPLTISPIDDVRATRTYRLKVAANLTYKLVKALWEV